MAKETFIRYGMIGLLSLALAACGPAGTAQETQPAGIQTMAASETEGASPMPEASARPENTPTTTATATPEQTATPEFTATPEAIEFPSEINPIYKVNANNLEFMDWGEGYVTKAWRIYIRTQDLHLDEATITMDNGRYHIQGWADAWFMETDGTGHHISVPLIIFDTETYDIWSIIGPVMAWPALDDQAREIIMEEFTGPFNENHYATYWLENFMCFTASGERDCKNEYTQNPYYIDIGYIPTTNLYSTKYRDGLQSYVEFLKELLQEVYTKDNVEAFWQTFDPNLLQLDEPNLPPNFIIPLSVH